MTERISCVALDYGSTLTSPGSPVDPILKMRRITPAAVWAVRDLHEAGMTLILASNTKDGQDRREALRRAGILDCFSVTLQSATLGVEKPNPRFYALVLAAAGVAPERVVSVGDRRDKDIFGPINHGMKAVLVQRSDFVDKTPLPPGVKTIPTISHLPDLLETWR
ncbi:HAD family hydrolase [Streptosporangium sp. NPDC020072]|uniref:HAD family hydrolase n=1 Tax=Streptosporangium sp. NPDC020072 TaxID=3154788 RepID=UPI00344668DC